MNDILEFQGEYRWLSNFWPASVALDGVLYASVENAYQAAKTHPTKRGPFVSCTAGTAKRLGRCVEVRPDWEQVKLQTMRLLIQQKFAQGTALAEKLAATGECLIVEGNNWGDTYWGVCNGRGQNNLGRLIMEQREALHAARP